MCNSSNLNQFSFVCMFLYEFGVTVFVCNNDNKVFFICYNSVWLFSIVAGAKTHGYCKIQRNLKSQNAEQNSQATAVHNKNLYDPGRSRISMISTVRGKQNGKEKRRKNSRLPIYLKWVTYKCKHNPTGLQLNTQMEFYHCYYSYYA